MKRVILALIGISVAIGIFAHEDNDTKAIEYNLAELLNLASSSDQEPLSREQLRDESDVIVNGVIKSITPGRKFYSKEDVPVPIPIQTVIFEVSVNYVEKGFEGETLFFEYIVGGIPAEILNAVKPDEQLELFLRESWLDEVDYRTINAEGRTKGFGEHLYYPKRDIALVDQLPRERRYDISAILRERGEAVEVDGAFSESVGPDADDWDVIADDAYLPEDVKKLLENK